MVEFNKEELLNNFSQAIGNNEYKPLPYTEWRALKATPGDVIIVRPHVTDSNKICIHWQDTLTKLQAYINAYDINDGSFGSYLYHRIVYDTQNDVVTKAKDMIHSKTKYWCADRVKLLDKFATEVADGIWHKMPYQTWRILAHTSTPKLIIERVVGKDDNYEYSVYENTCITFTIYEDFGAFLDNLFGSPTLTYKAEAEDMTYNSSDTWCSAKNETKDIHTTTTSNSDYIISSSDNPYWSNAAAPILMKTPCDEDDVRRICEDIINNKDKENKKMDTSNLFNFDFGPVSSNQFRMSPYGLAVRTQTNGWVAYNAKTGDLMDVDILNFDISKMIYKMPVALTAIKPGDILMHGGKPVFVREVATGDNTVRVIDYANATVADILPVKSPFGFNFYIKVWPLFNFDQASANSDNPFGNMLPFLMLKDDNFDPTLLFMASAMNGGNMDFASNPMMLYCLMNRQDKGDILPFLMMMNGSLTGMGVSTPASSTPMATATT